MTQHVEIHFKMIGHVILPALDQKKLARLQWGSAGRMRRRWQRDSVAKWAEK